MYIIQPNQLRFLNIWKDSDIRLSINLHLFMGAVKKGDNVGAQSIRTASWRLSSAPCSNLVKGDSLLIGAKTTGTHPSPEAGEVAFRVWQSGCKFQLCDLDLFEPWFPYLENGIIVLLSQGCYVI